jgi:hypothetical protein
VGVGVGVMVGVGSGVLVGAGVGGGVLVGVDVELGGDVLVGAGVGVEVTDGVGEISVVGSGVEVGEADSGDGVTLGVGSGAQDTRVNPRRNTTASIFLIVMNIGLPRKFILPLAHDSFQATPAVVRPPGINSCPETLANVLPHERQNRGPFADPQAHRNKRHSLLTSHRVQR